MKAEEYMNQVRVLENSIQRQKEKIERLRAVATKATVSYGTEAVSHSRNQTSLQDVMVQITEAESILDELEAQLTAARASIIETISKLTDDIQREVLYRKYLDGTRLPDIAAEHGLSLRWAELKHRHGLDEIQRVLD